MKTNILKYTLLTAMSLSLFTSCVKEDDYETPAYKKVVFSEGFENSPHGSGSNEVPVALEGWLNVNLSTGTRLWSVKQYNSNKFAEFSSFYSVAPEIDEAWLITPEIELKGLPYVFSFATQARFHNYNNLSVYVSQDFDGTSEGISTATWQEIVVTLPTSANEDVFVSSGEIDFSQFQNSKIRIGFKYVGSKQAGQTTTFQIDNITIFEK